MLNDSQRSYICDKLIPMILLRSDFKDYVLLAYDGATSEAYVLPKHDCFVGKVVVRFQGFDHVAQNSRLFYGAVSHSDLLQLVVRHFIPPEAGDGDWDIKVWSSYSFWSFMFRIKGDSSLLDIELTITQVPSFHSR